MTLSETRLGPIVRDVRRRSSERRAALPLAELRRRVQPDASRAERFRSALSGPGLAFIAECKRRSPSAGSLGGENDWLERARAYARGGAAAISVLTESDHFDGSTDDLAAVEVAGLPRLRKDFLIDEGMLLESALFGAEAVLLLPLILEASELSEFCALASELGLATLVEVHDARELERAIDVKPDMIGVNARDLRTFEVDLATVESLLPEIPSGFLRVAESGLRTEADLARVRRMGADAALVGEALMRAEDPSATLAGWRARIT